MAEVDSSEQHYNKELKSRTYLANEHLTCADLIVFFKLHAHIVAMDDVEKYQHMHLLRWFNNVQHLPQVHEILHQMQKEFVVFPVKVSKKQLKLAEKKKEKEAGKQDKRDPRQDPKKQPQAQAQAPGA